MKRKKDGTHRVLLEKTDRLFGLRKQILSCLEEHGFPVIWDPGATRKSGYSVCTHLRPNGTISVGLCYDLRGRSKVLLKRKGKHKERKTVVHRRLREAIEHLMANGFRVSEDFPATRRTIYLDPRPQLYNDRLSTYDSLRENSLLCKEDGNPNNPSDEVEPGSHTMIIRGENSDGSALTEKGSKLEPAEKPHEQT